ncbi:hypothetical protein CBM2585_A10089 [Cupriavidus taiwanensis]|nr:hypothetical protein CBM2585_A10089 [Cupriavidus taiwanensis]
MKCLATVDSKTTFALIRICADDFESATGCVFSNFVALILGRILLMFGRHADILRCPSCQGGGYDCCTRVIG